MTLAEDLSPPRTRDVPEAVDRAVGWLREHQHPGGWWKG
ncbi:MAG: hypothetical protein QOF39_1801, partial [Frankiales bacterium]|nr:hypothetical protein [Frankiales bacterium]